MTLIRAPFLHLKPVIEDTLAYSVNRAEALTASRLRGNRAHYRRERGEVQWGSTGGDKERLIPVSANGAAILLKGGRCSGSEKYLARLAVFAYDQEVSASGGARCQREDLAWAERMIDEQRE